VPLLGFAGAPWTLMAYMVEGSGQKSYNNARTWMYKTPEKAHELLHLITQVTIKYLIGQVQAGAQMLEVAFLLHMHASSFLCTPLASFTSCLLPLSRTPHPFRLS
jgi:hypothetical protein